MHSPSDMESYGFLMRSAPIMPFIIDEFVFNICDIIAKQYDINRVKICFHPGVVK